jgi:hypothetical protein
MTITREASSEFLNRMLKDKGILSLMDAMRVDAEAILDYADEKFDERNLGSVVLSITLIGLLASTLYSYLNENEWENASDTVGKDVYKTMLELKNIIEKMKLPAVRKAISHVS